MKHVLHYLFVLSVIQGPLDQHQGREFHQHVNSALGDKFLKTCCIDVCRGTIYDFHHSATHLDELKHTWKKLKQDKCEVLLDLSKHAMEGAVSLHFDLFLWLQNEKLDNHHTTQCASR